MITLDLIRKHIRRLVETDVLDEATVKAHQRTSKKGKVFTVQQHERKDLAGWNKLASTKVSAGAGIKFSKKIGGKQYLLAREFPASKGKWSISIGSFGGNVTTVGQASSGTEAMIKAHAHARSR
jgi:hypothetical protein